MPNSYYFIINPASLKGNKSTEQRIRNFFSTRKETFEICYWDTNDNVSDLVSKGIELGYTCMVACGGDGTILQVGRAILNMNTHLGILPLGSGNGIARHFNISTELDKALYTLVSHKTQPMDIGKAGKYYFFSNIGFGVEVNFIKAYQKRKVHGIKGYMIALITALFGFQYKKFTLQYDDKLLPINPYVFLIANTNEQGYGISLTPMAQTNDGELNLLAIPRHSWLQLIYFAICTLFGKPIHSHQKVIHIPGNYFKLKSENSPLSFQIDGEFVSIEDDSLEISVLHNAIEVVGTES